MTTPPIWEQVAKTRELDIYEREVAAREREVAAKEGELKKSRWSNPVVIALLAGALGLAGNAIVAYLNNQNTRQVERMRSQSDLILEAIRTGSPEKACTNLVTFIGLGLVDDAGKTIRQNCQTSPATGPFLPVGNPILSSATGMGLGMGGGALAFSNVIQGIVLDADSHKPVDNALVSVEGLGGAETDTEGNFRLELPTFSSKLAYNVTVEKEGYQSGQAWAPAMGGSIIRIDLRKK